MNAERRLGLDFARFLALAGMVIVHFRLLMLSPTAEQSQLVDSAFQFFEGKAAATFVVLAGLGFGIAYQRSKSDKFNVNTLKKSVVLFVFGLANMMAFEADIIHFYALYFILALAFLPLSRKQIAAALIIIVIAFPVIDQILVSYDTAWDWDNLFYVDLWTINGFTRNLFFNGWHPVFPWFAFFLFGIILSKSAIYDRSAKLLMVTLGIAGLIVIPYLANNLQPFLHTQYGPDIAANFLPSPIPPGPLYILNGTSAALLVIGASLLIPSSAFKNIFVQTVAYAGQQSLTLYFAHILIGMGIIEALGLFGKTGILPPIIATELFLIAALVYVHFWRKKFERGPAEAALRRLVQ